MKKNNKSVHDVSASMQLDHGKLYKGVVEGVDDANRQVLVAVGGSKSLIRCTYAGGIFSSMFGLQTKFLPQKKTHVLLLCGNTNYIIGCLPSIGGDIASGDSEVITGTLPDKVPFLQGENADSGAFVQPHAIDLLEGELDLTNAFSVGIRLLTTIASLDAGGRAKVEALLLDDMVRIVSENFKHYTAFGNYEIYNDGRLNVRFDGTSYPHESYGVGMEDDRVNMKGYEADLKKIKAETGRWRFSEYVGFLGDFVTKLVTDPTAALGAFSESNLRAGKSRVHQNADGTILMQSVSDIVLERVCRIPVPVELEEPKATGTDFSLLERQYLKLWEYGESVDDMATASFQLREYARWLSNYHAYARFHQLKKEWKVPSEAESPVPDPNCAEPDKARVNNTQLIDVYATIRIMRDGSIVILNGRGSSVVMAGYDVYVSSARDLVMEAARDITLTAGGSIHAKARKDITLAATLGQFVTKSKTMWKALCTEGIVWLKSDKSETHADYKDAGILLDAQESNIHVETGKSVHVLANGPTSCVQILAKDSIDIQSYGDMNITTPKKLLLRGLAQVLVTTPLFESSAYRINFGGAFSISGGRVAASVFSADIVQARTTLQGPARPRGKDSHLNHIDIYSSSIFVPQALQDVDLPDFLSMGTPLTSRSWGFTEDVYDSGEGKCETYAQQYASLQNLDLYEDVDINEEALQAGKKYTQKSSRPWPGRGVLIKKHTGGEELTKPSNDTYSSITTKASYFTDKPYTFRAWKQQ